jgi:hypothetical protein
MLGERPLRDWIDQTDSTPFDQTILVTGGRAKT